MYRPARASAPEAKMGVPRNWGFVGNSWCDGALLSTLHMFKPPSLGPP